MVVAPVAEASVDLCAVASGLVCLPCLPPFAINKAQAAGGGLRRATSCYGRTGTCPVQSSGATRKDSARLCARSLAAGLLLLAASCHMPKQRKREAKERRRVWLRCFVPAFFLPATTLPFDPFVLLISLPPWIEEGKKPSESVHTPIGRTDRLRCWSARFSVIVARTGGERWTEDGESVRVRTCTARHGTPGGAEGARAAP